MLPRTFHLLRAATAVYPLAVFWVYVGLFVLTFSLVFVFPPGALLLVFVGLAGLGLAVVVGGILRWSQRLLARMILRRGACPHCMDAGIGAPGDGAWECRLCGSAFLLSGSARDTESEELAVAGTCQTDVPVWPMN